jgi:gliding motility associated protien GldN
MKTLYDAIKSEKLIAYEDEGFRKRMTAKQFVNKLNDTLRTPKIDPNTGEILGDSVQFNPFNPENVHTYRLKEDIFFDKVRGRVYTITVGIAPIIEKASTAGGGTFAQYPIWLYYPQCRVVLASKEIYDTRRELYNISYDDVFLARAFKSQIIKESNPADLYIESYPGFAGDTVKQKAESDRIEREINKLKKDVWKY